MTGHLLYNAILIIAIIINTVNGNCPDDTPSLSPSPSPMAPSSMPAATPSPVPAATQFLSSSNATVNAPPGIT